MKLRIRGNSVRLRLQQAEVATLAAENRIEQSCRFPGRELVYAVETHGETEIVAVLEEYRLCVRLPIEQVKTWSGSSSVSLAGEQALGDGEVLRVLVEKDFACLDRRDAQDAHEDDSDAFPHPMASRPCQ